MKKSARTIQAALDAAGLNADVVELPASTRSAKEAAAAVGCAVAAIAKSIVFESAESGRPVLVIASGVNRIDESRVAEVLGEPLHQATPDSVRAATGFAIGGVPPFGHASQIRTFVDRDLLQFDAIWAAAGTPNAVFKLRPGELVTIAAGEVIDVK